MNISRLLIVLLLLAGSLAPVAVRADTQITLEITPFFGGAFRAGHWLPVRVVATNSGPDRRVVVQLDGGGASYDGEVDLPRGSRKAVVLYVRPDGFARSLKAWLVDGKQELATASAPLRPWPAQAHVIGVLAAFPLTPPAPSDGQAPVVLGQLSTEDVPARAEGLQSFSALVVDGVNLAGFSAAQWTAIDDWLRAGGQLVVGAGSDDRSLRSLPDRMRIATAGPAGMRTVDQTVLAGLGLGATIEARTLTPAGTATAVDVLTVKQAWERGSITILGFSLGDLALQRLSHGDELWSRMLDLRRVNGNMPPDATPEDMEAQQLTQALFNLPALAMPPLGTLAALLITYIVLAGPLLYLLLRRLDRLAWAWIAIPLLTLLFSVAAYGYGLRIRGKDIILNQISVVQVAGERAYVRSYAGIFSPVARTYDITVGADALTRPLRFDARVLARPERTGAGGTSETTRFVQTSPGVRNLAVGQWTMNTFGAEATVPFGSIVARFELGDGTITATVQNRSAATIRRAAVIFGNQTAPVGDLAPGAERRAEMRVDSAFRQNGEPLSITLFKDRWDQRMGPPAELRVPLQMIDALYSSTPWGSAPRPVIIGWLDASPLPMRVDATQAQYQQTTLIEIQGDISYARSFSFPRGWIQPEFEDARPDETTCMTQWGTGQALMRSDTVTATLRLPATAPAFQLSRASVFAQAEGPPLERPLLEIYDWDAGRWTKQSETLGMADLSEPARFLHDHQMRVRLKLGSGAMRGACVHIGASFGGSR